MTGGNGEHRRAGLQRQSLALAFLQLVTGLANEAVTIGQAEGLHFVADIVDIEHGRLRPRLGDIAAGLAAALDQSGIGELRQRLVHGHARTAILLGQIQLEGDAVAGRPRPGNDLPFDIRDDALMQRLVALCGHRVSVSCFIAARKRCSIRSRRTCRPPSTCFTPWTQTQSGMTLPAKIQPSRTASSFR